MAAKGKIDRLSKVILEDQGNPNGSHNEILGLSLMQTMEHSWINIIGKVMNLSQEEKLVVEYYMDSQTGDNAETELQRMFARANWGSGHTNTEQPALNPAILEIQEPIQAEETFNFVKAAISEITGGLNYGQRSPRDMSRSLVTPASEIRTSLRYVSPAAHTPRQGVQGNWNRRL
ncbi:unnamed protein product, partial [Oikopleura dioica]